MTWYKSRWTKLRRKSEEVFVVLPEPDGSIPRSLDVNEQWKGYFPQTDDISEFAKTGIVVVEVWCTHRDRPYRATVRFIPSRETTKQAE